MDTQKALAHLERFCHQVSKGLTSLTFDERQQLLRLVIERISVENGVARIDAVIPPDQDNLRNRYPETVEGPASVIPEPKPVWFWLLLYNPSAPARRRHKTTLGVPM